MTCRFLHDVLLIDSVRFDPTETQQLESHAAACAECGPVLARLREARAVQRAQIAEIPPDARVVVWAALQEKRVPVFLGTRSMAALAAFATVAVAWLVFHRPPQPPSQEPIKAPMVAVEDRKPIEPWVTIPGVGRVRTDPATKWRAATDGAVTTIHLDEGPLELELDAGATAEIVTLDARVRVIGGRAIVERAPRGTDVRADKGTLTIWARGQLLPVALDEGQQLLVPVAVPQRSAELSRSPRAEADPQKTERAAEARKTARATELAAEELKTARATELAAEELKTARDVIETDAPRAAEIAERVLSRGAPAELEAEALAVLADAERRRGLLKAAAASYAKLRDHPRGRGYAEEAMLQRALLLERLRELDAALAELSRLEALHPSGVSAPERAALAAKIYLEKNDPRRAAQVILEVRFEGRSRALENRRAEVARALAPIDPALAKLLMASKASSDHSSEANR